MIKPIGIVNFSYTRESISHKDIEIGAHTYGCPSIIAASPGWKIKIGDYTSISQGVNLHIQSQHKTRTISTYPFPLLKQKWPTAAHKDGGLSFHRGSIIIGNDVWIGANATILGGAEIGDGAIIGSNAVVAGKIPPYAIAIGNPAKVIKYRFNEDTIEKLLKIKWWEWPIEKIQQFSPLLSGENFEAFFNDCSVL